MRTKYARSFDIERKSYAFDIHERVEELIAGDHQRLQADRRIVKRGKRSIGTTDEQLEISNRRLSTMMVVVQAGLVKWMNPAARNRLGGHWIGRLAINISSLRCRPSVYAGRLKVINGEASEWQNAEWIGADGAAIYGRRMAEPCVFNGEPAGLVTFVIRRDVLMVVRPAAAIAGGGGWGLNASHERECYA